MIRRILLLVLTVAIGFYAATEVQAQGNEPTDNEVNEIAKGLYCPVCPNTPLDVCETQACQDWREEIKTQLIAGWTKEEIEDYFVEQYGERVLAEPARSGFTSMVWILPVVAVLLGLIVVAQALRSWKSGSSVGTVTAVTSPAINPDTLDEIEQELRHLE
jgi:cytochrome c-type biogenesis protein CcmH